MFQHDAKAWLIKLQQVDGRGYSSIHSIRGVLRPAFQLSLIHIFKEVLQDKADEKKAQRTVPAQTKHKQQDMEL